MKKPLPRDDKAGLSALDGLLRAAGTEGKRGIPPVERWNPPFCGDIDMRIRADGSWDYLGTPIGRPAMVRLFSTILKREGDAYFLVTPVEKVGIAVDDLPFLAVEMAVDGEGDRRTLSFRTGVDDVVSVGAQHALRVDLAPDGGLMPAVHVRAGLWARLTRALVYDLVALGETRATPDGERFGIMAGGSFHSLADTNPAELGT